MICIMTYFDQSWPWGHLKSRDLRSNFDLDLLGSNHTCFDASRRGEHDSVWIMSLSLSVQKLSAKNTMVNLGHWRHLRGHHLTLSFKYWYCRLPPVKSNMFIFISSRYLNQKGPFCLSQSGGLEWETGPELAKMKHTLLDIGISSSTDPSISYNECSTNVSSSKADPDANNKNWNEYPIPDPN